MKWRVSSVLLFALTTAAFAADDLVFAVRKAAALGDFQRASSYITSYEDKYQQTPTSLVARSWLARTALDQKDYQRAEIYAQDTYQRSVSELKKRPLDREPELPLALGAAIEVHAQILVARGQRLEAVSYLNEELQKYGATSIRTRIQKNINLLSLVGKLAPPLEGESLPRGRPALIFFWAHWCPDCRAESPTLARLKKEYGPKGLVFLGPTQKYGFVAGGEDAPANVELRYIEQIRQQFYSAIVPEPAVVNEENFITYGVSTTPTLTLIDRKGIVRLFHPGSMTYEELRPAIESVLRAPSPAAAGTKRP